MNHQSNSFSLSFSLTLTLALSLFEVRLLLALGEKETLGWGLGNLGLSFFQSSLPSCVNAGLRAEKHKCISYRVLRECAAATNVWTAVLVIWSSIGSVAICIPPSLRNGTSVITLLNVPKCG